MNDLLPGTYRLRQDVINPKPDRRSKQWDKLPVLEAGTLFAVEHRDYARLDGALTVLLRRQNKYGSISVHSDPELFEAIAPHLAQVIEEPSDYLAREWPSSCYPSIAPDVLDDLVKNGHLTMEQFLQAVKRVTST